MLSRSALFLHRLCVLAHNDLSLFRSCPLAPSLALVPVLSPSSSLSPLYRFLALLRHVLLLSRPWSLAILALALALDLSLDLLIS